MISPENLDWLLTPRPRVSATRAPIITHRELEVLRLVAEGLSNQAIAERLTLSVNTVRTHVQNVLDKLGAHSKLEAVVLGTRLGLVSPT